MYSPKELSNPDELVERYAPLVQRLAYHLMGRLPSSVQVDDLIQAGMLGLLDAARQYSSSHGASFETYASIRIRGAMLDELRRLDWVPKSVHRRAREIADAIHRIESNTGQAATDTAVARMLGISLDEYHHALQEAQTGRWLSLDELTAADNPYIDAVSSDGPGPLEEVAESRFQEHLAEAVKHLPERERLIISLYYDRMLNLKEIGAVLGVGESRVCQLMGQAHARLRARLKDWIPS